MNVLSSLFRALSTELATSQIPELVLALLPAPTPTPPSPSWVCSYSKILDSQRFCLYAPSRVLFFLNRDPQKPSSGVNWWVYSHCGVSSRWLYSNKCLFSVFGAHHCLPRENWNFRRGCSSCCGTPPAVLMPLCHQLALPPLSWLTPLLSVWMKDLAAQEKLLNLQTT